jgi:hypothetical protein
VTRLMRHDDDDDLELSVPNLETWSDWIAWLVSSAIVVGFVCLIRQC